MIHITNGLEPRTDLKLVYDYVDCDDSGNPTSDTQPCIRDMADHLVMSPNDLVRLVANLGQIRDALKSGIAAVEPHMSETEANSAHADMCQALDVIGWVAGEEVAFIPDHAVAPKRIEAKDIINDPRFEYIFRCGTLATADIAAETIATLIRTWMSGTDGSMHTRGMQVGEVSKLLKLFADNKELLTHPEKPETMPKLEGIPGAIWAIKQANPHSYVYVTGFKKIEVYDNCSKHGEPIAVLPSSREVVAILRTYALINEG